VQQELRAMLRSFRPSRVQFFTKLLLPATCPPSSPVGRSTSASRSVWSPSAELVGAVSGVGYGLVLAQELFSVADVFAWTLVLVSSCFSPRRFSPGRERMLRGGHENGRRRHRGQRLRKLLPADRHR
jgi:ABC-type nitrate/sulfonate/bicarbonate transport system permease component